VEEGKKKEEGDNLSDSLEHRAKLGVKLSETR